MAAAIEASAPRVVYPPFFELANRLPRLAGALTSRVSPAPIDAAGAAARVTAS